MPNLLFLSQRIPYPPNKGEKIRALKILEYLRRSHDIHLGCLVDDPADWQHVDTVRAMCADSYFARLDRSRAKIACLRGLANGQPLSVEFFRHAGLAAWVDNVLDQVRPEAVFVYSSNMAPYSLDGPRYGQRRVVDLVDIDSEKWRAYAEAARGPMRWVYTREWHRMAALERRIARECDASIFVSGDEASRFVALVPDAADRIHAVSNGVDPVYFDPALDHPNPFGAADGAGGRADFVFTGTMDYPPNVDAVVWFVHDILPLIRRTRPDARFHIVGHSPTDAVRRLGEIDGVSVTGRVADVRPYVAHATAAVAPMRIARGIQNKVLEAMAMGRPVIVTPDALAGIAARTGSEIILGTDAASFAAGCLRAAGPDGGAIGAAARRRVLADYVWEERLHGLDPLLGVSSAGAAAPQSVPAQ